MKVEVGGVSIEDKKRYKYFIVTMDNLQVADSGIYQCGIEHWLTNTRHDVTVTVFPGKEFSFFPLQWQKWRCDASQVVTFSVETV